ncbi:MAG: hypothetical protein JSS02_05535 [Planctomycetes bacterium]|nr:hypothetical protein [Planctomycetota bacterium]
MPTEYTSGIRALARGKLRFNHQKGDSEKMMPPLTTFEHEQARNLAYFIALKRGNWKIPSYDRRMADEDFIEAAGHAALYEQDPDDEAADRQVPVALRQFPQYKNVDTKTAETFDANCAALNDCEYWTILGHIWVHAPKKNTEFNHAHSQRYCRLFASPRLGRDKLMTPTERSFLLSRRDTLTVFRGCQQNLNERGLSWTFGLPVAIDFAYEYYNADKIYLTGECAATDVIAYFNFSKEFEVIIPGKNVNVIATTPVPYPIPQHLLRQ